MFQISSDLLPTRDSTHPRTRALVTAMLCSGGIHAVFSSSSASQAARPVGNIPVTTTITTWANDSTRKMQPGSPSPQENRDANHYWNMPRQEQRAGWSRWLAGSEDETTLARLRHCTRTGRASGGDTALSALEQKLGQPCPAPWPTEKEPPGRQGAING